MKAVKGVGACEGCEGCRSCEILAASDTCVLLKK